MRTRALLVILLIAVIVGAPLALTNALAGPHGAVGVQSGSVVSAGGGGGWTQDTRRATTAVLWTPVYEGAGSAKVGVLGDSIAAMTLDDLAASLEAAPFQLTSATFPGLTLEAIIDSGWPSDLAVTHPDHVVVIAGTNDVERVSGGGSGLVTLAEQGALIDALPLAEIHWVRLYVNPPDPPPGLQERVRGFNAGLEYWAARRSNVHLVDWPAWVVDLARGGTVVLRPDGIHPTGDGQALLAAIVDRSIVAASGRSDRSDRTT